MRVSTLALCGVLASTVLAAPLVSNHVLHERREYIPSAWAKRDRVRADLSLPVRIGLTQSNLDKGYDLLMEVSQHDSPRFGQHYTAEEVIELFAPAQHRVDAVRAWLEAAGVASHRISLSANKQWLQFDAPTSEVEELLNTQYHAYEHVDTGKHTLACEEYHVPAHIQEHIDYITPGIKLFNNGARKNLQKRTFGITGESGIATPQVRPLSAEAKARLAVNPLAPTGCGTEATPACIKALYNITTGTLAATGNKMGIFESLADVYAQADLNSFFAEFSPNIPAGTAPLLEGVDGATAPDATRQAGPESDLDFQMAYPIIFPQGAILFQTDDDVYQADYTFEGFFNTFLDALDGSYCTFSAFGETGDCTVADCEDPPYPDPKAGGFKGALQCGVYTPTNVISISYGGQESDLPASYQERQCDEFMKLGLQGVSIVVASGDSGVANPDGTCIGPAGKTFSPTFPNTCPFVTNAGSTFLPAGANVAIDAEVSTTRFPSGGGFSNIYPIPSYQATAVNSYLTNHPPPYASYSTSNDTNIGAGGGLFNRAGRAYPDVAAIGDNVVIFNRGEAVLIGGTSAAAPCFASILNRINEERLAVGKSTVGFVNPTIYANPQVFHDITTGSNPGCGTNGFATTAGWDPVSGLGTPNYPSLLALYLSLP